MRDDTAAGPIRFARMLASRELRLGLLAEAAVVALLAGLAARRVAGITTESYTPDLLMRLIRRFDITLLFVCALLLTLRIALRVDEDRREGWLEPVCAAGALRWRYGVALAAATAAATAIAFVVGAVTFAAAVRMFAGTDELLVLLPRTLVAGVLLLGTYAVCTTTLALIIPRVPAVLFLVAALALVPLLLFMRYAISEVAPPHWALWLSYAAPLVLPPPDLINAARALLYVSVGALLTGLASTRYAGRRP